MDFDIFELIVRTGVYFVPFLFSLCVHEFAHGWVAKMRGDNTAQMMGRLTLNPGAHADLVGTYILPLLSIVMHSPIFFGWAKPVPVNPRNLKNPRADMFWIASAGPLSNILLAVIGVVVYVVASQHTKLGIAERGEGFFGAFIYLNLFLAVFNLIPIHPLDGGKVIARFIPPAWDQKLQENQMMLSMVLMMLFLTGAMRVLAVPVFMLAEVLFTTARTIL